MRDRDDLFLTLYRLPYTGDIMLRVRLAANQTVEHAQPLPSPGGNVGAGQGLISITIDIYT
jgi:hypothetical protein